MSFSGLRFVFSFFFGWDLGFGLFLGGFKEKPKETIGCCMGFTRNDRKAIGFVMDFNQKPSEFCMEFNGNP